MLSIVEIFYGVIPTLASIYPGLRGFANLVAVVRALLRGFKTVPAKTQIEIVACLRKAARFVRPGMTEKDKVSFWNGIQKSQTLLEGGGEDDQEENSVQVTTTRFGDQ